MSQSDTFPLRLLKTEEAARPVGLSRRTLEKHRTYGTGPAYRNWAVAWSIPSQICNNGPRSPDQPWRSSAENGCSRFTAGRFPAAATTLDNGATARSMAAIARQPTYLVALLGAATGYGIMILAMTATPLAMVHHHHSLADASVVFQLHVLGMFLPSLIIGPLIA